MMKSLFWKKFEASITQTFPLIHFL